MNHMNDLVMVQYRKVKVCNLQLFAFWLENYMYMAWQGLRISENHVWHLKILMFYVLLAPTRALFHRTNGTRSFKFLTKALAGISFQHISSTPWTPYIFQLLEKSTPQKYSILLQNYGLLLRFFITQPWNLTFLLHYLCAMPSK